MNRGKDFEQKFREQLQADFDVTRIADNTAGYMGGRNICDFMAYRFPNLFYLELKTTKGNTLPFSNITDNQYSGLIEKESIMGVGAGYIVWFLEHDKTFFVSGKCLKSLKEYGKKSLNIKEAIKLSEEFKTGQYFRLFEIEGTKKRVFFDYDMKKFLSDLEVYLNYGKTI